MNLSLKNALSAFICGIVGVVAFGYINLFGLGFIAQLLGLVVGGTIGFFNIEIIDAIIYLIAGISELLALARNKLKKFAELTLTLAVGIIIVSWPIIFVMILVILDNKLTMFIADYSISTRIVVTVLLIDAMITGSVLHIFDGALEESESNSYKWVIIRLIAHGTVVTIIAPIVSLVVVLVFVPFSIIHTIIWSCQTNRHRLTSFVMALLLTTASAVIMQDKMVEPIYIWMVAFATGGIAGSLVLVLNKFLERFNVTVPQYKKIWATLRQAYTAVVPFTTAPNPA